MNRGIRVLQTLALPLGYVTVATFILYANLLKKSTLFLKRNTHTRLKCGCFFLERATRLELATSTLARWRSTR